MFSLIGYTISTGLLWRTLLVILIIASLARHYNIPYEVGLVVASILTTFFAPKSLPIINPSIYLEILLPPLIFHTALHLNVETVKENAKFMYGYALIGTVTSAILLAIIGHLILGFDIISAVLLGIIVSPTDPVAVVSIMKGVGTPDRLVKIIEGEALFNDGAAIAIFTVVSQSHQIVIFNDLSEVVISLIIGHIVGFTVGYLTSKLAQRLTQDVFVQMVLSLFAIYTSFELSSVYGEGGIIGSAVTGIVIGNLHLGRITDEAYEAIDNNWEFIDFLITSLSFVLIGSVVDLHSFYKYIPLSLLVFISVLATRIVTITGVTELLNFGSNRISSRWQLVASWAGIRGIVSIMLVLSLSSVAVSGFVEIVFGIVLWSLLFQGLSLGLVVPFILGKERSSRK